MGLVRSGFAAAMGWRPKSGKSGIWFVNISAMVDGFKISAPVFGHLPSFRRTARISVDALA